MSATDWKKDREKQLKLLNNITAFPKRNKEGTSSNKKKAAAIPRHPPIKEEAEQGKKEHKEEKRSSNEMRSDKSKHLEVQKSVEKQRSEQKSVEHQRSKRIEKNASQISNAKDHKDVQAKYVNKAMKHRDSWMHNTTHKPTAPKDFEKIQHVLNLNRVNSPYYPLSQDFSGKKGSSRASTPPANELDDHHGLTSGHQSQFLSVTSAGKLPGIPDIPKTEEPVAIKSSHQSVLAE